MSHEKYRVLFVCTGNSARSIIAEAVLDRLGRNQFNACSAGSEPRGEVHPLALWVLRSNHYPVGGFRSKSLDEFVGKDAPRIDFVFTVCDHAAEHCPVFPGQTITAHWGLPDPAAAEGTEAERKAAFQRTLAALERRISMFLELRHESLDKPELQSRLDAIGVMSQGQTG